MANPTTATFSIPLTGDVSGAADVLLQWALTAPSNYEVPLFMTPGFNVLTTGVTSSTPFSLLVIIPPDTNVQTMTLKGVTGDTGFPISPNTPTIIAGAQSGFQGILLGAGVPVTVITRWF